MREGLAARKAALHLIRRSLEDGLMLDEAGAPEGLCPPERARALTLARETLRRLRATDALIAAHVPKAPKGAARDALRLGLVEMLALGGAPHAVVDAAVRLTKADRASARAAGLVNAVLRKVTPAEWAALDVAKLSMPGWLRRRLRGDWGRAAADRIAAAHLAGAPLDLTTSDGAEAPEGARTPTGSLRLGAPGRVSGLPGYEAGGWWAQDAAAALPARLAGAGEARHALDLCAAPGGKTMQLAAAGWRVTALDASAPRLRRLSENLARTRLTAEVVAADALTWTGGPFDLVLLDAPCSATGTIRRHPELPLIREGEAEETLALQSRLLEAAWALTKPGGALIYCVCSLFKSEGEDQIAAFLGAHPEAARDPIRPDELPPEFINEQGDLRTRPDFWPELGGMDGFFAARLTRAA